MRLLLTLVLVLVVVSVFEAEARPRRRTVAFDEDEFEGLPTDDEFIPPTVESVDDSTKDKSTKKKFDPLNLRKEAATAKPVKLPESWGEWYQFLVEHFMMESAAASFLLLATLTYFTNAKMNRILVEAFMRTNIQLFASQFYRIDFGDKEKRGGTILKDGPTLYRVYGSGRQFVEYSLTTFNMQSRQNLFHYLANPILGERDVVTMEAKLTQMPLMTILLCSNIKEEIKEQKLQPSISELQCQRFSQWREKDTQLTCLAESKEVASSVVTQVLESTLRSNSKHFISLFIGDQAQSIDGREEANGLKGQKEQEKLKKEATSAPPLKGEPMIVLRFRLPPAGKMPEATPLLHLFFLLLDAVPTLTMSQSSQSKSLALRKNLQEQKWKELKGEDGDDNSKTAKDKKLKAKGKNRFDDQL